MEKNGSKGSSGGGSPTKAPYMESQRIPTEKEVGGCLRGRALQVASVLAANVISLSFGNIIGYPSVILTDLQDRYTADQISWLVTASTIGGFIGSGAWSLLTPRFGPKRSTHLSGIPILISWCLLLDIDQYWFFFAGRLLNGIGMGGMANAVPHYVSDISEDALRGTLGTIMVVNFNVGTLITYILGMFLSGHQLTLVCIVIPAIFLVVFLPFPESPAHLMKRGRADESRYNLRRLRFPRDVNHELASFKTSTEVNTARWADLFKQRAARKTLGISLGLLSIGQLSGFMPLLSYVGDVFQKAGGSVSPLTGASIVTAVQLFGSFGGMFLIDRAGRRILMLSSCLGMAVCQGLMGYALMPNSGAPGWLPVTALSGFMVTFSIGAGSIPFIVMNEMSTPSMRPKIAAVTMIFYGVVSLVMVKTYSNLSEEIGIHGVFWTYAAGCVAGLVFTFFFMPETVGRSNASIQEEMEGRKTKPMA